MKDTPGAYFELNFFVQTFKEKPEVLGNIFQGLFDFNAFDLSPGPRSETANVMRTITVNLQT